MKSKFCWCLLAGLMFWGHWPWTTTCLVAQETTLPVQAQPNEIHQWLHKFVGTWDTDSKGTMGPGQPEINCKGTIEGRSLGELWVLNEMKADMVGTTVTGVQTIGFDIVKKKIVGTWVDSSTSYMWHYEGRIDDSKKVLTLEADGPNFMDAGKTTKFHDVYTFKSDDEVHMESKMLNSDGKWVTFMTGKAVRRK